MTEESSTKPYFVRAVYEWCTDNGYTPYIAVAVDDTTVVPRDFVKNGEIVLNISALATSKLTLGNEFIDFQARFGGSARSISVPIKNVTAIYARENGHGMAFEVVRGEGQGHDAPVAQAASNVKPAERPLAAAPAPALPAPPGPGDGPKRKPRLTVVK
jgi:stringent starvation protein B